ncbi:MAG: VWA domain-containing protein [Candidatus Zambryskibacteria bacterium]|nr:VWA domain-containing protein [Candidatus Zambryskibacteria bacterium]
MDFEQVQIGEVSSWASRRKTIFLSSIVLVLFAITYSIFWYFWYSPPSCSDGVQNGDETGIDCGGSCPVICSTDVLKPIIRWDPRMFEISPGVWNALVYVENPNVNIDATYVPYKFVFYDENNQILEEREGATILPKAKTVGIFEGSILTKNNHSPQKAIFEIGKNISWDENGETYDLDMTHGSLENLDDEPRVEANIKNNGVEEIKNIELVIAIFDGYDNAVAASRTFIESLKKNQSQKILFTWPRPFNLGFRICEKPSDIVLALDKSGSMAALGQNPPQPLTDAKTAASFFTLNLGPEDGVGVVSFATEAINISNGIISDFVSVRDAIESIKIESNGTQYTNIFDALHKARLAIAAKADNDYSKIIILLTDGIANNPQNPEGKTEEDDIKYAENLALEEAIKAKTEGLIIYTIGLGNNINESFLKKIASEESNYFFAPTADNLKIIYKDISYDICKEIPARIEITYKIFGDSI